MSEEKIAGMGEIVVSHNDDTLTALGLGSCIGLAIVDEEAGIGGLAHIMLPSSDMCKNESAKSKQTKFADRAIPILIQTLLDKGAKRENLKAKMVGGAHMFPTISDETMNIGKRNAEATEQILQKENIPIIAKEVGGNKGRTFRVNLKERKYTIKTIDGIKEI